MTILRSTVSPGAGLNVCTAFSADTFTLSDRDNRDVSDAIAAPEVTEPGAGRTWSVV